MREENHITNDQQPMTNDQRQDPNNKRKKSHLGSIPWLNLERGFRPFVHPPEIVIHAIA